MALDTQGVGITLRCIKGEEWPTNSFSCLLDLKAESVSEETITFNCPSYHSFTLAEAIRKGIFTQETAQKILVFATEYFQRAKADYDQRVKEGWRARPTDFVPNQEVVAKGWRCVKCNAPAQWGSGDRKHEKTALCLTCAADWHNYGPKQFDTLLRTSGRAYELGWNLVFQRFLRNDPPLNEAEARELLEAHRKQAKQESRERSRTRRNLNPQKPQIS